MQQHNMCCLKEDMEIVQSYNRFYDPVQLKKRKLKCDDI